MSDYDQQKIPNESFGYPQKPSPIAISSNNPSRRSPAKTLCALLFILVILAGLVVLILWLVYRPHKPNFSLVDAAIYDLNVTSPPYMSTSMQFTVLARNPNRRVRLDYDQFSAIVYYKGQAITPPALLPPLFQKTKSTVILSPLIRGASVPVSVEVANGLLIDEVYGVVGLRLVLMGKMRYKAGIVKTKHYQVYVKCDMLVGILQGDLCCLLLFFSSFLLVYCGEQYISPQVGGLGHGWFPLSLNTSRMLLTAQYSIRLLLQWL